MKRQRRHYSSGPPVRTGSSISPPGFRLSPNRARCSATSSEKLTKLEALLAQSNVLPEETARRRLRNDSRSRSALKHETRSTSRSVLPDAASGRHAGHPRGGAAGLISGSKRDADVVSMAAGTIKQLELRDRQSYNMMALAAGWSSRPWQASKPEFSQSHLRWFRRTLERLGTGIRMSVSLAVFLRHARARSDLR
jgi:hypothetical protein